MNATAAAPDSFALAIPADSPLGRKVARLARQTGADPLTLAAAALETMLACAKENPDTLARIVWRARQKSLASQLKGA